MSYEKQNFQDGQVLTAEMLNKMEQYFQHCPQCYSEEGVTELLPETSLALNEDIGGMPLVSAVELRNGENYTVVWNNDEYEVLAQEVYDESSEVTSLVLGNIGAMTGGESTDEPFVLIYSPETFSGAGCLGVFAPLDGSAEATVKIIGSGEIVHKLEVKFLPVDNTNIANSVTSEGATRTVSSAKEDGVYKLGNHAFAEGYKTKASGDYSHAEGFFAEASGNYSHAECTGLAQGNGSHAEGQNTFAIGHNSHAEGTRTRAEGHNSHAEGESTIAAGKNQHVQGRYNAEDFNEKYAHIVGNGYEDQNAPAGMIRSNAYTLDWDGNAWFAGAVEGNSLILRSSNNSGKRFKITVNDNGEIKATPI